MAVTATEIKVIVFDKDGTLLDFAKTWLPAFAAAARRVAQEAGAAELDNELLQAGGWVEDAERGPYIDPEGVLLHGTNEEWAQICISTQPRVASHFAHDVSAVTRVIEEELQRCTVRDATPLGPVEATLSELRGRGIKLAVVTNDSEAIARAQLATLGWTDYFVAIIGADSGHGAKPGGGGIGFAITTAAAEPTAAVMVGDSQTDLLAGRAAGCAFTVAIHPADSPLPPALSSAAAHMPDISQLTKLIATA